MGGHLEIGFRPGHRKRLESGLGPEERGGLPPTSAQPSYSAAVLLRGLLDPPPEPLWVRVECFYEGGAAQVETQEGNTLRARGAGISFRAPEAGVAT